MTKYKKYLCTCVQCYDCKKVDFDNLVVIKNVIDGVDVTLCKDCLNKHCIEYPGEFDDEVTDMAKEIFDLREQFLRNNLDASDLIIDVTLSDVKRLENTYNNYFRLEKTILIDWKDVNDEMHHDHGSCENDFLIYLKKIRDNYNCVNYLYWFNFHFDQNNKYANRLYGYLKALVERTFPICKVTIADSDEE